MNYNLLSIYVQRTWSGVRHKVDAHEVEEKHDQSHAAIYFSAITLVGFMRTSTSPSPLFLLPYASALFLPTYIALQFWLPT